MPNISWCRMESDKQADANSNVIYIYIKKRICYKTSNKGSSIPIHSNCSFLVKATTAVMKNEKPWKYKAGKILVSV